MGQMNAGYRARYLYHVDTAYAQEYIKKKKDVALAAHKRANVFAYPIWAYTT